VTHIDAKDVGACLEQVGNDASVWGCGAEGRDDLGPAQTSHQLRNLALSQYHQWFMREQRGSTLKG
jgi:hypothetical protein